MKQDTGKGETVEAFVELLEARAELGDIHHMTFDEHMMFRMLTAVQDKGMLTEWRRIKNPTMPKMKIEDVKCDNGNRFGHISDVCLNTYYNKSAQSTCSSSTQKQTVRRAQSLGPALQQKQQPATDPPFR